MTKEELAAQLNGCEYNNELLNVDIEMIKKNNLVIVSGHSDYLIEFEGAIDDEGDCYGGGAILINKNGVLGECEDDCISYRKAKKAAKSIKAIRDKEGYAWIYETDIPHACFDIMELGTKYCRGIVFSIDDV